jgi:two-component system catabolic regulation response regulator CreB
VPVQTIVVAEDDAAIRDLVAHHLEREGFLVAGAPDGPAALRRARSLADLLVLDVGLPGIDGFEVARTIKRERPDLPIVMLTGRNDEVDRVVGFELGVDDYVCKRSCSQPKKVFTSPCGVAISPPTTWAKVLAVARCSAAGAVGHSSARSENTV